MKKSLEYLNDFPIKKEILLDIQFRCIIIQKINLV